MQGDGRETYEPRFTFHGFRYVEVTGFPGAPKLDDLTGCVVHSACESAGDLRAAGAMYAAFQTGANGEGSGNF